MEDSIPTHIIPVAAVVMPLRWDETNMQLVRCNKQDADLVRIYIEDENGDHYCPEEFGVDGVRDFSPEEFWVAEQVAVWIAGGMPHIGTDQ